MLRIYEENGNFGNEDFAFDLATTSELHGFLEERDLFKKIRDFYNVKDGKRIRIHLKLHRITQNLDMSWERKMRELYQTNLNLEKLMWNLATLGGAYSAMGDFDWRYAETAAKITEQQMLLARKYGDPSILARCYLYSALADAQLGEMARAERMVRAIYYWATQVSPCFLVEKCAQGTFKKLVAMKKFGVKNGISGDDEK